MFIYLLIFGDRFECISDVEKVGFWPEKPTPPRRNNGVTVTPTSVPDNSGDSSTQRECSHEEYDFMKENLLLYNNARLMDSKKSGKSA